MSEQLSTLETRAGLWARMGAGRQVNGRIGVAREQVLKYRKSAIRNFRAIAQGASENQRAWFHEREVIDLALSLGKGYQATYFHKQSLWRTRRGYSRLWRDKSGVRGLIFSFHHDALEVVQRRNPTFTEADGIQNVLKYDVEGQLDKQEIYPIKFWGKHENPKLADILTAQERYTTELARAIYEHTVLFETDYKKGVYRSGAAAYVFEFEDEKLGLPAPPDEERKVIGIQFYAKREYNDKLVNPYGEGATARLTNKVLPGTQLLQLKSYKDAGLCRTLTRQEAEAIVMRHHHGTVMEYVRTGKIVSAEDEKQNRGHYLAVGAMMVGLALFKQGRYYFRRLTLESAAPIRSIIGNGFKAIYAIFLSGFVMFVAPALITALNVIGLLKPKINQDVRIDPKDPTVKQFSRPAKRIAAFATLQRRFWPHAFANAEMILKPTFDKAPPLGIKSEQTLDAWPADLAQTSGEARGGSVIHLYSLKNAELGPDPLQNVRAQRTVRTDGITSVNFVHEDIVWQMYAGDVFYEKAHRPPEALIGLHRPGYVLQINNLADDANRMAYIPLAEAEAFFHEQFARPLWASGLAKPEGTPVPLDKAEAAKSGEALAALREGFHQTARQMFAPETNPAKILPEKIAKRRTKMVDHVMKEYTREEARSFGAFRPFVEKLGDAIEALQARNLKYNLYLVGRGAARSLQLSCDLPDGGKIDVMTQNSKGCIMRDDGATEEVYFMDFCAVENSEVKPLGSAADTCAYIHSRIQNLPVVPPTKLKRVMRLMRLAA